MQFLTVKPIFAKTAGLTCEAPVVAIRLSEAHPSSHYPVEIKKRSISAPLFRDPAGARTRDPNIKSVVLYRLSYRINACQIAADNTIRFVFGGANVGIIFRLTKFFAFLL